MDPMKALCRMCSIWSALNNTVFIPSLSRILSSSPPHHPSDLPLPCSGLQIIRPGGMVRPKDDFQDTQHLRLAAADTSFGGQVSALQVCLYRMQCMLGLLAFMT